MKKSLIAVAIAAALALPAASQAVTFVDLNLSSFNKPCATTTTLSEKPCGDCNDSVISSSSVSNECDRARNVGLGLEFQTTSRVATGLVGVNLGNWNEYAAAEYAPINSGTRDSNFSAGLLGAIAHTDSVGNYPTGGLFVSINRYKYGFNLIATPTVNSVPAFIGVQLRYRFGDEKKPVIALAPTPVTAVTRILPPPQVMVAPIQEETVIKRGRE